MTNARNCSRHQRLGDSCCDGECPLAYPPEDNPESARAWALEGSMKSSNSIFKFSEIKRSDWNVGAALFTLNNMGALARKLQRGEDEVVLCLIAEMASAYLIEHGHTPPDADYTPPPDQIST